MILTSLALERALANEPIPVRGLVLTGVKVGTRRAAESADVVEPVDVAAGWDAGRGAFTGTGSVGPMRVEVVARPGGGPFADDPRSDGRPFYATHLRHREQHIDEVRFDRETLSLRARIAALDVTGATDEPYSGLQSGHPERVTVAESIVCLAQLAQVMAYEYDQVTRDASSTFWMRRLEVSLEPPYPVLGRLLAVRANLMRAMSVRLGEDDWRTLRLNARAPGLRASADVAHALPGALRT